MKEKTNKVEQKQPEKAHEEIKNAAEIQKTALKQEESKSKDESKELIELLQRVQAEFENYKKRAEKEKQEIFTMGKISVIVKVLDIVDNFERAIETIKLTGDKETQKGIEMMLTNLHKILEEEGIKAINAEGKNFDPYAHEAMKVENSDSDNIVLKELQKGYIINNKVIRTSKVVLGKKTEEK